MNDRRLDLTASARCCREMLEALRREGGTGLVLLGDLLYHGPRTTSGRVRHPGRHRPAHGVKTGCCASGATATA